MKTRRGQTQVRKADKVEAVIRNLDREWVLLWMLESPETLKITRAALLRDWEPKAKG